MHRQEEKLLVIEKSKNPRCFKGVDVGKLPVTYRWNTKAWMTGVIFMEWISEWDRELREAGCRILLLVDNCSAHPALDTLTNIHLEFLPLNTTSMIQPMDQGVIRNLKVNYRKQLISLTLSPIEEGLLLPTATATDVSSEVNVFDAVQFVSKSWRLVQPTTISNCFRKAGFQKRNALPPPPPPDLTYMSGPLICRVKRQDKHPSYIRTPLYKFQIKLSYLVTVYWHRANQSLWWPYNAKHQTG